MDKITDTRMRARWSKAVARAIGTLAVIPVLQAPPELTRVFDDAMRIHICEVAPAPSMVDAMEEAWWATEDVWEARWSDDEAFRTTYEAWSDAFSHAHELLLRWLDAHTGQR